MLRKLTVLLFVLGLGGGWAWAGKIHFFVDEQGNKVFYNIPAAQPEVSAESAAVPAASEEISPLQERAARYDELIVKHATTHNVDPVLVKAVMGVESAYDPLARSNRDAHGLMQLIPATARRFGVRNIYDASQNIEGGIKYLRFLIDMFRGDLNLVLASYNAGENRVQRVKGIPRIRETQDYVAKITRIYGSSKTALAQKSAELEPAPQQVFRIVRTRDENGNIVLTNRPTRSDALAANTFGAAGSM